MEVEASFAGWASGSLEGIPGGDGVDVADGADAAVASEDLVAEVARISAEAPLVDAVITAKGTATFREDLKVAPAAEREIVRTARQGVACDTAAGKSTGREHAFSG